MHVTSTRAHADQCAIKRDHLKRVENVQRTPRTNSVVVSVLLRAQACVYFVVVLGSFRRRRRVCVILIIIARGSARTEPDRMPRSRPEHHQFPRQRLVERYSRAKQQRKLLRNHRNEFVFVHDEAHRL